MMDSAALANELDPAASAEARWTEASLHVRQAGDQRDELEALSWVPLMLCASDDYQSSASL